MGWGRLSVDTGIGGAWSAKEGPRDQSWRKMYTETPHTKVIANIIIMIVVSKPK